MPNKFKPDTEWTSIPHDMFFNDTEHAVVVPPGMCCPSGAIPPGPFPPPTPPYPPFPPGPVPPQPDCVCVSEDDVTRWNSAYNAISAISGYTDIKDLEYSAAIFTSAYNAFLDNSANWDVAYDFASAHSDIDEKLDKLLGSKFIQKYWNYDTISVDENTLTGDGTKESPLALRLELLSKIRSNNDNLEILTKALYENGIISEEYAKWFTTANAEELEARLAADEKDNRDLWLAIEKLWKYIGGGGGEPIDPEVLEEWAKKIIASASSMDDSTFEESKAYTDEAIRGAVISGSTTIEHVPGLSIDNASSYKVPGRIYYSFYEEEN